MSNATIITFASPKGGVGKSTCCLSIAGALASKGYAVHIIDFDLTQTLHRWFTTNKPPIPNLTVEAATEENFLQRIKANFFFDGFLLIDVAGHYNELMLRASAIAALTITPSKLNEPDLIEASKLRRRISDLAQEAGKPAVEHRVLVNELPSSLSGHHVDALHQLSTSVTLKRFNTMIATRGAYSEAYVTGLPPHFANQKRSAIRSATLEIDALTDEILSIINQTEALAA